ncbi:MAG: hypothetical protein NC041_07040 [Bacteroides sp.]|nr:hypothetical protein [Prevotella sp.]MCM1407052.1 hypothetical protein [Treponema brennaborense]MCM1470204.1 hypothetical protein [Bacteroides sp.]
MKYKCKESEHFGVYRQSGVQGTKLQIKKGEVWNYKGDVIDGSFVLLESGCNWLVLPKLIFKDYFRKTK